MKGSSGMRVGFQCLQISSIFSRLGTAQNWLTSIVLPDLASTPVQDENCDPLFYKGKKLIFITESSMVFGKIPGSVHDFFATVPLV